LYVEAGGDLRNATGRLLANATLVLSVGGVVENATETSQPSTTFQRNTTGAPLLPFKAGLYHLARADPTVECVPVWIDNLNRVMPKGEVLPVPLLCSVSFGEPLNPREGEGKQAFLARARAALLSLAPSYRWTVA